MGSDGRRLWWQLSTDCKNAAESNARCQEELAFVRTFSTFPGINNVNPISLRFNLMNQNEALAHKSLARCHGGASQLKLWGALLLMHYSQTEQLSAALFLLSSGSWRPKSPPPLKSTAVLWRTELWVNPEPVNPGQTFATMATLTDLCLRRWFPIVLQVLLPSTFTVHCAPNDLISRCTRQLFYCRKKKGNHPNISVICQEPNGAQISNKLKSKSAQSPNILFTVVFCTHKTKMSDW